MPLATLPPELLHHLLASAPTLPSLLALALTCRRIHAVFQASRATLIYSALATELGPVLADALGLALVQTPDGSRRPWEVSPNPYLGEIEQAFATYAEYLARAGAREEVLLPVRGGVELEEVLGLVRAYWEVRFVAEVYVRCMLRVFEREVKPACRGVGEGGGTGGEGMGQVVAAPVSRTEWLRILRATYRLRMALHLWGSRACGMGEEQPSTRINLGLFGLWKTWEVQQFACMGAFYQEFRCQLSDVWLGAYSKDPRRAALTQRLCCFGRFREFVVQVQTADEALWQAALDRERSCFSNPDDAGTEGGINSDWHRHQVGMWCMMQGPVARYKFPASLCFNGDEIGSIPFGWVDAFDGHYLYDFLTLPYATTRQGKPAMGLWCRLGFVMWDAPRVEAVKTASFLSFCGTGWARSSKWRT